MFMNVFILRIQKFPMIPIFVDWAIIKIQKKSSEHKFLDYYIHATYSTDLPEQTV